MRGTQAKTQQMDDQVISERDYSSGAHSVKVHALMQRYRGPPGPSSDRIRLTRETCQMTGGGAVVALTICPTRATSAGSAPLSARPRVR